LKYKNQVNKDLINNQQIFIRTLKVRKVNKEEVPRATWLHIHRFNPIFCACPMPGPGFPSQLLWCFYVQWFEVIDVDIVIIRLQLSFHYFYLFAAI
jgi:hypothetical protein